MVIEVNVALVVQPWKGSDLDMLTGLCRNEIRARSCTIDSDKKQNMNVCRSMEDLQ